MTESQAVFRAAEVADAPVLAGLHLRTVLHAYKDIFPEGAPAPTLAGLSDDWQRRLRTDDRRQTCIVAEVDATPIGVIIAGADPRAPVHGHLSRLHVEPSYWQRGIGSALYARAVAHLRMHDFATATLWVLEHNRRARGFYERRGWTLTGDRVTMYAPGGIDDVEYRLEL